jgi:ribonuclease HII
MHAYIGYHSVSAIAGPIVICLLWDNGSSTYTQVDINSIDITDLNSSLMAKLKRITRQYPEHRFTVKSIFTVARNCRSVMNIKEENHFKAEYNAKKYFEQIMVVYEENYKGWGFSEHGGENNKLHRDILNKKKYLLPVHRRSFWPCTKYSGLNQQRRGIGLLKRQRRRKKI